MQESIHTIEQKASLSILWYVAIQDCSKWKVQKLRACQDCKELYDEAKDQNEFLRQKEEKSKRDKIRRAKKI